MGAGNSGRTTPIYALRRRDRRAHLDIDVRELSPVRRTARGIRTRLPGDLIVGDFNSIVRMKSTDGSTVWETSAVLVPLAGTGGAALGDGAAYIDEQTPTGPAVVRFSILATGER